jgi:hypothetical protein
VRHVVKEHVHLDDAFNADTRLLQYAHNVLAALRRLVGDAAFDESTGVVGGDLAGHEDLGACDYGLGLCCVSQHLCWVFRCDV